MPIFSEKGFSVLIVVLVISVVLLILTVSIARIVLFSTIALSSNQSSRDVYYLSESGLEDSLLQLRNDAAYSGGNITTPLGTYTITRTAQGDNIIFTSSVNQDEITRTLKTTIEFSTDPPPITEKVGYASDSLYLYNGGTAYGNIWTNDNFRVDAGGLLLGEIYSGGKINPQQNKVWDITLFAGPNAHGGRKDVPENPGPPGQVLDNPDTDNVTEGHIIAFDGIDIQGNGAYVEGDITTGGSVTLIDGGTVGGTITEDADYEWSQISVPVFDYATYKSQAITEGTYYSSTTTFQNYVNSLDDGNTRTVPSGVYYVDTGGGSYTEFERGNPVIFNGTLISEKPIRVYSGFTGTAVNGLPILVSKKNIYISNEEQGNSYYTSDNVMINGIIFADTDIWLMRYYEGESIYVDGAAWAADDLWIEDNATVRYGVDTDNIAGFDFVDPGQEGDDIILYSWVEQI